MVKWLVIGIGDITRRRVLPAILDEPRSQLYGLLTRDPSKAQPYAGTRVFTTLDDALGDPAVDEGKAMLRASEILEALAPDIRM